MEREVEGTFATPYMSRSFARGMIFVFLLLAAALAFFLFRKHGSGADQLRSLATWGLADYLGRTFPNSRVLVLSNPFSQIGKRNGDVGAQEQAGIDGLKKGFGRQASLFKVVYPALKPGAESNPQSFIPDATVTTPLSFLVAPNTVDQLVADLPNCDLVVSLIGLPAELSQVKTWIQSGPPRFALLLPDFRLIGPPEAIRAAMHAGKMAAFVITKPGATFNTQIKGSDWRSEFDRRYLLVTRDNVDQFLKEHPELFRP